MAASPSQPYRVDWRNRPTDFDALNQGLSGVFDHADQMFQELYGRIARLASVSSNSGTTGVRGPIGPPGFDGQDGEDGFLGYGRSPYGSLQALANGGTGTTTIFTAGSIVFAGVGGIYTQDNANLFWDDTNNRLGIGAILPSTSLDVTGTIQASVQYLAPDGSNGTPSYSFTNSANSGFRYQSNEIAFVLNGVRWASVKTTGFQIAVNNNCLLVDGGAVNLLGIGGDSGSFPGIKRNGTTLEVKLANDSAFTEIKVDSINVNVTTRTARVHLPAGTASASTAPLKLTSGTVLTSPEAGAIEFTTDDFFATITTGPARKAFILDNGSRLTSGKMPIATTNGRLVDLTASSAYTPTNVSTDRAYDANATTLDELADVVGTIIADLQTKGILG